MAKKTKLDDKTWYALALARITLGLIFLWTFFDKLLGLGHETCHDTKTGVVETMCSKAWINGGSPTYGFLKMAASGPFKSFYNSMAENKLIAFIFMLSILLIGIALVFGIAMKLATIGGSILLAMMWSAVLPPENNPILDDHIVYILLILAIFFSNSHQKLGLGNWWAKQPIVKKLPLLA